MAEGQISKDDFSNIAWPANDGTAVLVLQGRHLS